MLHFFFFFLTCCIHSHVTVMVRFKANFLLRIVTYYVILSFCTWCSYQKLVRKEVRFKLMWNPWFHQSSQKFSETLINTAYHKVVRSKAWEKRGRDKKSPHSGQIASLQKMRRGLEITMDADAHGLQLQLICACQSEICDTVSFNLRRCVLSTNRSSCTQGQQLHGTS